MPGLAVDGRGQVAIGPGLMGPDGAFEKGGGDHGRGVHGDAFTVCALGHELSQTFAQGREFGRCHPTIYSISV